MQQQKEKRKKPPVYPKCVYFTQDFQQFCPLLLLSTTGTFVFIKFNFCPVEYIKFLLLNPAFKEWEMEDALPENTKKFP